jgi:hypothetical protein
MDPEPAQPLGGARELWLNAMHRSYTPDDLSVSGFLPRFRSPCPSIVVGWFLSRAAETAFQFRVDTRSESLVSRKMRSGVEPVCLSGNKRERDDEDGVPSSLPRTEGGVQESVGFGANKHGRHEVDKEASTPPP